MADSFLLKEDGSYLLLETGGKIILEDGTVAAEVAQGGSSGGRVKKHVGRSLVDQQLGNRPQIHISARSEAKIKYASSSRSRSRLLFVTRLRSEANIVRTRLGSSTASLLYRTSMESRGVIRRMAAARSTAKLNLSMHMPSTIKSYKKLEAKIERLTKLMKIQSILSMIDMESHIETFSFNEADFDAFTHSSSFVGNVRYDNDTGEMTVILNGKTYNFCGVPRRVYDAFKGANSKGVFFNREIKSLYDC